MRRSLFFVCAVLLVGTMARAYDEIEVRRGGAVVGRVLVRGERPGPRFLPVWKNADVCGARVPDESLRISPDGGLAGAVVEIEGIEAGKPRPQRTAELDNRRCAFVPRVQALTVGQGIEIRNSDPILHDAHAWLGARTVFNLGLPTWRRVVHVFDAPGLHSVDCNVLHAWMKAWILVSEHPYVVVTDADGRFRIDDIPAGNYGVRVWHETLGERRVHLDIRPSDSSVLEIVYPDAERVTSPP